jgi:cytochrome P450
MTVVLGAGFDPLAENPYSFYARARQEEPIVFCPDLNAWLVTRHQDIQSILLQPGKFSSCDTLTSPVKFSQRALEELIQGYLPVPIVLNTDGAEHVRFRVPLTKAFAPARIRDMEPFVRTVADRLVDAFIDEQKTEIISQFAYPLALEVVFALLGIPREDIEITRKRSQDWLMLMSVQLDEERQAACAKSTVEFQHYLARLVAERRTAPQDDLISSLLTYTSGDEPLTETELVITLQGLILAGHESTTNMLGTGLRLLLEHPEDWQALCRHPEHIPSAVEEILRFDAPIQMFARTTTQEVTVAGVTLPEEASLLLLYGSGNRDEAVFANADEFHYQRTPNHHLAFGHGMHFCVGAALARLEGKIAFEVLCQRLPNLHLVPGQVLTHIPTLLFRGYEHLTVEW